MLSNSIGMKKTVKRVKKSIDKNTPRRYAHGENILHIAHAEEDMLHLVGEAA
jgi:hypothetical protein